MSLEVKQSLVKAELEKGVLAFEKGGVELEG